MPSGRVECSTCENSRSFISSGFGSEFIRNLIVDNSEVVTRGSNGSAISASSQGQITMGVNEDQYLHTISSPAGNVIQSNGNWACSTCETTSQTVNLMGHVLCWPCMMEAVRSHIERNKKSEEPAKPSESRWVRLSSTSEGGDGGEDRAPE